MRTPRQGFACVRVDRGPLDVEVGIELRRADVLDDLRELADSAVRAALSDLPVYGPADRIDDLVVAEHVEDRILHALPDRGYRVMVAHRSSASRRHHVHIERAPLGEPRQLVEPDRTPVDLGMPTHPPLLSCRCVECCGFWKRRATASTRATVELPCLVCGEESHAAREHKEKVA